MGLLTGNTYGNRVARIGASVLLAFDFGGGVQIWDATIISILNDGTPVIRMDPMVSSSWEFASTSNATEIAAMTSGQWTWPLIPSQLAGILSASLASDRSAVAADGWKTIHSATIDSVGGTVLSVEWGVTAAIEVGGKARCLIDGGAYSSAQIGQEQPFPTIGASKASSFGPKPLAAGSLTTYTVSIQVIADALGSVTCSASSTPLVHGALILLVERA